MTFDLDGIYSELLVPLAELCGLQPIDEDEARQRQDDGVDDTDRTVVHEGGGHTLVALARGIDFRRVKVAEDGQSGAVEGLVLFWGPSLSSRIALAVAGAVAEEVTSTSGSCDPSGCWVDLAIATARAGVPAGADADHPAVALLRAEVDSVRSFLRRERAAMACLAEALRERRSLTRAECVEVLRREVWPDFLGETVDVDYCPSAERRRVRAALAAVKAEQESRQIAVCDAALDAEEAQS